MTHGDNYNCKCPYCKGVNHHIVDDTRVMRGSVTEFTKPCQHCGKPVYYWARWAIMIDAEREEKVK